MVRAVAFISGHQRRPVSFIAACDIARAAVQTFRADVLGRYELGGPETVTFDGAFERLGRGRAMGIRVLHVLLTMMRLPRTLRSLRSGADEHDGLFRRRMLCGEPFGFAGYLRYSGPDHRAVGQPRSATRKRLRETKQWRVARMLKPQ
jgi:hypothetical protein